ncbi:ABC transporter substrate-binding protein [Sinirhodobacter populi]|uniref:ABC transporter substrate-binding protein n=1 Tax=Paenirhodobacter populi TaxID=2306993 RepID=A0A443K016_9RHOB|nr:ABC transporter substrate-binding protein [Sinirhodobacter populi]RWR26132.1 ABC transporter substrate-binding protein [Sinirhodobacter populi]
MSLNRRAFLYATSAFSLAAFAGGARAASPSADTRLVVADQSELNKNLLEASNEIKSLGFKLEQPNFAGGPAILEAIRAGALDAAYVGDVPPIQARASGTLLPIVATVTRERAQYILTSRPGLVINHLSELKGRKLSYVEGSGRQVFLIEALNRGGVKLDEVELVPLRVADLPDAIRSGAVDVAVLQEPHVTRLRNQIGASQVLDPEERRLLPSTSYIYARPEALADPQKSAALGEYISAWIRAGNWSNANPDAWGEFYFTKFQGISAEDTRVILDAQSPLIFQTSTEAIPHHQKLVDILYQAGALEEPFDAAGSFTDAFDSIITSSR